MSDRLVKVAATQMTCGWDIDANLANAESLVRKAANDGAKYHFDSGAVCDALFLQGPAREIL